MIKAKEVKMQGFAYSLHLLPVFLTNSDSQKYLPGSNIQVRFYYLDVKMYQITGVMKTSIKSFLFHSNSAAPCHSFPINYLNGLDKHIPIYGFTGQAANTIHTRHLLSPSKYSSVN